MPLTQDQAVELHDAMADHMDAILGLFKPGAKITVVVRAPDNPEGGMIVGSDDLDEAVAEIRKLQKRPPILTPE